jgi:F0F1-type ATP synthase membrane subunit b/b'
MPAIVVIFLALLQENEATAPWWDYPGLELWKFVNLLLFVAAMIYFLKRPLSQGFKIRRENIRKELLRAREERDKALAKLTEVESR